MQSLCINNSFTVIITLFFLQASQKHSMAERQITFDSVQCNTNTLYFSNFSTEMINSTFNMSFNLLRSLLPGYRGHIDMQMRLTRISKYQRLFFYDFDVCDVLHNIKRLKLMKNWMKEVIKHGNFMENCPIAPGHYYLRNMVLDSSNIPVFLQAGDYRIVGRSYFGKFKKKSETFVCECKVDMGIKT